MWQAPNQRVRALQTAKKRQQDRLSRPLHIKRVRAEIRAISQNPGGEAPATEARVILNDFSAKGMGIFASQALMVGQEVAITLQEPKQVYLRGRIVWCQEYDAESHVLSANPFSYRMGIKFVFQSKQEEQAVAKFCDELFRQHLYGNKAA